MHLQFLSLIVLSLLMPACASTLGMQERFAVCSYDVAWEAALDAVKDRSVTVKDKDGGHIETAWLEVPNQGHTYGVLQREVHDSRDRSRLTLIVKQLNDVTKISFAEERQRWTFRGGSRLFGWAETEPSEVVRRDIQTRLEEKLKEHGCSFT
ncbi:MAG TPA: hypothetical protein VIR79_07920 [Nitrospira sp.]